MPVGLPTHHVVAAALTWPVFVSAPVFSSRTMLSMAFTGPCEGFASSQPMMTAAASSVLESVASVAEMQCRTLVRG